MLVLPLLLACQPPLPPERSLVVVAPRRFHAALTEFVAHKRALLPTGLFALEEVLARTEGADDAERLKRWLYDRWRNGMGYALLVGDADVLPVRYMVLDRVTAPAFDYAFYPSDLYYADLAEADGGFEDWNARRDGFHDGYWGEVRGEKNKGDPINFDAVDYRPEIALGRWPVSTEEEVARVARKTIEAERARLRRNGAPRAAIVHCPGWIDAKPLLEGLARGLESTWQVTRCFDGGAPTPSEATVVDLLNQGLSLLAHTGHGHPSGWEHALSLASLDRLRNAAQLPVVVSIGCSTAAFATLPPYEAYVDVHGTEHRGTNQGQVFAAPPPPPAVYQRDRCNATGLGEQMLRRADTGAVAYVGCNTGSQPCALTLLEGFVLAMEQAPGARLGDCWSQALRHYVDRQRLFALKPDAGWYPPSIFFQGMKFMLFGDPSLALGPAR